MLSHFQIEQFRAALLGWFYRHRRDLPWRRTRDPYAIWISEVMLQQTRVNAVIPYYERFLQRFPTLQSLAEAPEPDLLAHWAGLGYYYRVRNLQRAARQIVGFPVTYAGLREMPGIGEYTAAAVASIAFNLPHAVVDGNVYRVLSRVLADGTDIASSKARKHFTALAEMLLDREHPGDHNQAVMELGATICLSQKPQCLLCPISAICRARAEAKQEGLPIKIKPSRIVDETRTLFWIESQDRLLVWQRPPESRLMPGFWELPELDISPEPQKTRSLGSFKHGITFHNYKFEVVQAEASGTPVGFEWKCLEKLANLPLSTVLKKAWKLVKTGNRKQPSAKANAVQSGG